MQAEAGVKPMPIVAQTQALLEAGRFNGIMILGHSNVCCHCFIHIVYIFLIVSAPSFFKVLINTTEVLQSHSPAFRGPSSYPKVAEDAPIPQSPKKSVNSRGFATEM